MCTNNAFTKLLRLGRVCLFLVLLTLLPTAVRGESVVYKLVNSAADLEAGARYVIGCSEKSVVMGSKLTSASAGNYLPSLSATFSNGTLTTLPSGTNIITLGGEAGAWSLSTESGYICSSKAKNMLYDTTATSSNKGLVNISFNGDNADIKFADGIILKYNSGSPRFTTYSSGQNSVQLYKEKIVNAPSDPVLTPSTSCFAGSLLVKASCATEGATIHFTTDGTEPTTSSTVFPAEGLTLDATTTVKAIAVKNDMDNSAVTTATYTKFDVQAGIAALKMGITATSAGVDCAIKFTNAVVTCVSDDKAYIQEEGKSNVGLYLYGNKNNFTFSAGDKINGTIIGKYTLYSGLNELVVTASDFTAGMISPGATVPVTTVTLADLTANFSKYESMRVKVVDATVTAAFASQNATIEQSGTSMALRAATTSITADLNAQVTVMGYPGLYNTTKQLNVMTQEDILVNKPAASISFDKATYDVDKGTSVTLTATTNTSAAVKYTSDNPSVATIDEATGLLTALAVGSAVITASVEENSEYTASSTTCTVVVTDPNVDGVYSAVVTQYSGTWYGMTDAYGNSNKNKLASKVVDVVNGKVITDGDAALCWTVDATKGTIRSLEGKYVTYASNGTNITLETSSCQWTVVNDLWYTSSTKTYALGFNTSSSLLYFGAYQLATNLLAAQPLPIYRGYTRNLTSGNYATICLPRAVKAGDMAGAVFYSVAGKVTEDTQPTALVLSPVTELEAGQPYIMKATADKLVVAYTGAAAVAGSSNGLVGSLEGTAVAEGKYVLSGNKVVCCGTGCSIAANRAYIDMDQVSEYIGEVSANCVVFNLDGGETATQQVKMAADDMVEVFTADGVRVRGQVPAAEALQGLPKGIYYLRGAHGVKSVAK